MATQPLFVNKRSKIQVEDGFEVQITNEVELFKLVDDVPTSIRKLPVGTKVVVDAKKTRPLLKRGIKFVYVQTEIDNGYIPKYVINDFVFAQKFKEYTGVSYGGDKWTVDATGNAHAFPISDGKHRCPACGRSANTHKLYETNEVQGICMAFVAYLGTGSDLSWIITSPHGNSVKGSVMLGVLETDKGYIFAHSGQTSNFGRFTKEVGEFAQHHGLRKYFPAPALADQDKFLVDKYGNDISIAKLCELAKVTSFQISEMVCAAPKLIHECYRLGQKPLAMSEKWSGTEHAKYSDQDTIKSCDRCRKFLSYMLCGVA